MNFRHRFPDRTAVTVWASFIAIVLTGFTASYSQALIVVQAADGPTRISWFVAALADPAIFATSANILSAYEHDVRGWRGWPWASFAFLAVALAMTGMFNVMAGHPRDVPSWIVRLWPAVTVAMAIHALMDFKRRRALRAAVRVTDRGAACPHEVASTLQDAVRAAYEHARDCEREPVSFIALGEQFGINRLKASELVRTPLNGRTPDA